MQCVNQDLKTGGLFSVLQQPVCPQHPSQYVSCENFIYISYDFDSEKPHVTASILWQQGEYVIEVTFLKLYHVYSSATFKLGEPAIYYRGR